MLFQSGRYGPSDFKAGGTHAGSEIASISNAYAEAPLNWE
jgi:hypothetical protein